MCQLTHVQVIIQHDGDIFPFINSFLTISPHDSLLETFSGMKLEKVKDLVWIYISGRKKRVTWMGHKCFSLKVFDLLALPIVMRENTQTNMNTLGCSPHSRKLSCLFFPKPFAWHFFKHVNSLTKVSYKVLPQVKWTWMRWINLVSVQTLLLSTHCLYIHDTIMPRNVIQYV